MQKLTSQWRMLQKNKEAEWSLEKPTSDKPLTLN